MTILNMSPLFHLRAGSGDPVFLLHGLCGASGYWLPAMAHLARGFDVIAPDFPGFGRSHSSPPCATLEEFADQVLRLADSLGIARFGVVGHSMGGFVGQQLLCSHSERLTGVVLYGCSLRIDPTRRFEPAERTIQRFQEDGPGATADRVVSTWFVEGDQNPFHEFCRRAGDGMTAEAGIAGLLACHRADLAAQLSGARTPVLVLAGAKERTVPPELAVELHRAIPGSDLCILPDCAHAAHLQRPELFNAVVADFFSRCAKRA